MNDTMGPLGFILLLGGIGSIILGLVGVVADVAMWEFSGTLYNVGLIGGGLAAGAVAAAILE